MLAVAVDAPSLYDEADSRRALREAKLEKPTAALGLCFQSITIKGLGGRWNFLKKGRISPTEDMKIQSGVWKVAFLVKFG